MRRHRKKSLGTPTPLDRLNLANSFHTSSLSFLLTRLSGEFGVIVFMKGIFLGHIKFDDIPIYDIAGSFFIERFHFIRWLTYLGRRGKIREVICEKYHRSPE